MKPTIIILLLAFGMKAQRFDAMLKDDKNIHFICGQTISSTVGSAYFLIKPYKPFKACLVGFVAGSLAGLGKEIYDNRKGGSGFDSEDLKVTIWGSLVGSVTLRVGIHEFYGKKRTILYNELDY